MRYVVFALAVLLSLTALGVQARPAAPAPAVTGSADAFGVDVDSSLDAAAIARLGSGWIRIAADWSALEPARGQFAWRDLDLAVQRASGPRVHLVAVLVNTPRWAALTPDAPESAWRHQPPRNLADWDAFVQAAASRYRSLVAAWQIEPALDFAMYRGTLEDYVGMLHAARSAVRRADPQALVIAASPSGLDLSYTKTILARAGEDFDALVLTPQREAPENVLEALTVIRTRILPGDRHQLWIGGADAGGVAPDRPDSAVGTVMVRMAAAELAGGAAREFWSGRQLAEAWAPVRQTIIRMLGDVRFVGWLPRGPGVYALVFTDARSPVAVLWSTGAPARVPLDAGGSLSVTTANGDPVPPSVLSDPAAVQAGPEPVFVRGLAASVEQEAATMTQRGAFEIPRDPAQDFSHAPNVSITLGAVNTEQGLYNQRYRAWLPGAVVPVTVDGVEAVRTDQTRQAVYVYLDVDHSFVYFVDGREDLLVTVEVHRAEAPQRVGFNLYYDSTTGYRFTPWQWVEAGTGWATYTIRLADASFSGPWGWDFAVNGAGNKKEDLVVRSVTVRKVRPGEP